LTIPPSLISQQSVNCRQAERPGGKQRSILVRPRLTVDNGEAIRDAAIAGMGLTVLPTFLVADALRAGKLLPVLQDTPVVSDGIFIVYPPDRHLSTKVRALIEHLTAAFKGALRWEA
jgi:DNA-binding transcriptional LysR family regulator